MSNRSPRHSSRKSSAVNTPSNKAKIFGYTFSQAVSKSREKSERKHSPNPGQRATKVKMDNTKAQSDIIKMINARIFGDRNTTKPNNIFECLRKKTTVDPDRIKRNPLFLEKLGEFLSSSAGAKFLPKKEAKVGQKSNSNSESPRVSEFKPKGGGPDIAVPDIESVEKLGLDEEAYKAIEQQIEEANDRELRKRKSISVKYQKLSPKKVNLQSKIKWSALNKYPSVSRRGSNSNLVPKNQTQDVKIDSNCDGYPT
jgi:hypothetical protein